MNTVITPLIGGLIGTAVMTAFLLAPRWLGLGHVDVIRAAGALMTHRTENAFRPGLALHLVSGVAFAYVYWGLLSLSGLPLNFLTGTLAGFMHGAIVMLLVSIVIMEHHPVAKYHHRGPMTGIAQLVAHVLYGATVGLVVQTLQVT